MVSDEVRPFLWLIKTYSQLKYNLPRTRKLFEKGVYDRLLREFALAARVDLPEGSKNAVYLHAILKLSESDFKNAMRNCKPLKTEDSDFFGTDYSLLFGSYIEDLRKERQLERFLMEIGKHVEEAESKQFRKEWKEQSINSWIDNCRKTGWDWLEKTEREADEERERGKKKGRG